MLISELGYGGAEGAFLRLARQLAKHHRVEIAVFKEQYDNAHYTPSPVPDDIKVHRLDHAERRGRLARWRHRAAGLKALRGAMPADVTISFLTGPNLLNALAGGRGKTIVSIRGSRRFDAHAGQLSNRLHGLLLDPIVWRRADAVVTVSEGLSQEIGRSAPKVRPKLAAISGYVDAERLIAAADEPVEPEFEALAGAPLVVAAGRLSPEKGFDHLLRVMAGVQHDNPDAGLLLIGDGPARASLERQARSLGLANIHFAGFRREPHRYFRLARAFALCSASEGFPNILVEALASGTPVVAGDVPWGTREVLGLGPDPAGRPYPTASPTETPYGWLMPRIDDRRYDPAWVAVLGQRLAMPRPDPAAAAAARERVRALDCGEAAKRWSLLAGRLTGGAISSSRPGN